MKKVLYRIATKLMAWDERYDLVRFLGTTTVGMSGVALGVWCWIRLNTVNIVFPDSTPDGLYQLGIVLGVLGAAVPVLWIVRRHR